MRKNIYLALLAIVLVIFIGVGATSVRSNNQKLQLHEIELKSKETKLIELNQKYDEVIQLKTETDQQKEEQLKKIQELETERQRLERELQAKLDRNKAEQEKLATAAKNASGLKVASAASGSKHDWMRAAGIPESQWQYVDYIVSKESSWNPNAINKSSGACSLAQSLPCSKIGPNWRDPVVALKWQYNYVSQRYGGYAGAYSFWQKNSWY